MKYAFVIGSAAFIVPSGSVRYESDGYEKDFLKINSIHHDVAKNTGEPVLDIDIDVTDTDGHRVFIMANKTLINSPYSLEIEKDNIRVLKPDGSLIIQVHQLSDDSAMALEHNIAAELEVHAPIAVIRITGEFKVGNLHIWAENEKLLINDNGYATSAMVGKNQLKFTENGVVL